MRALRIWYIYTINSFLGVLTQRLIFVMFLISKLLRIGLFTAFLFFLFGGATGLGDYNRNQIIFFYLSFNLIDTLSQLLFREVYRFRPLIVAGGFDYVLTKPVSPLLRVLLGGADVIDLVMLVILSIATTAFAFYNIHPSFINVIFYLLLLFTGLVISAAIHIVVLGLGIISTSVDHLVMIYRDLAALMRIPSDLYIEPIRFLLTFIIPLGVMITFPAKSLMGLLSFQNTILSVMLSILYLFLSLKFWHHALKHYQSASS